MTYKDFKGVRNGAGDVFTNPQIEEAFYVNDVLTPPDANGVITLASQGTYVLRGRHYGKVVVGAASETALTADTLIILDGVEIYANDSTAYGIYYASQSQTMFVTLAANRKNTIICQYYQAKASNQGACLFSEKNMVVQGYGYLACINEGGHGVRASELRLSGNPHLYVEAEHDAIHGNSKLLIDDGFYFINRANDACGTGETGSIVAVGGTFHCFNIEQNVFDSNVPGLLLDAVNIITDTIDTVSGMTRVSGTSYFGEGSVKAGEEDVPNVDGVYTSDALEVTISGYVEGDINVSAGKVKVILNNAYLKGQIHFTAGSSNMQVATVVDTLNIIDSVGKSAIKSDNNVIVEVKSASYLLIRTDGNGIEGSTVTLRDTKGVLKIEQCGDYAVIGTDIYIADDDKHEGKASDEVAGAIVCKGNLHARLSSKGKKGNITVVDGSLTGIVYAEKISTQGGSAETTGLNLDKSRNVFYKEIAGDNLMNTPSPTYEPFNCIPCGVGSMPF